MSKRDFTCFKEEYLIDVFIPEDLDFLTTDLSESEWDFLAHFFQDQEIFIVQDIYDHAQKLVPPVDIRQVLTLVLVQFHVKYVELMLGLASIGRKDLIPKLEAKLIEAVERDEQDPSS